MHIYNNALLFVTYTEHELFIVCLKVARLIAQCFFVLKDNINFFSCKVQSEDAIVFTEHDFVAFKATFFHEMEVHANFIEYFDISHDNSKLLFEISCSCYFLKNEKLKRVSSFFDKLFTTDDGKVFFVLAFLNGQHLSDFTGFWLKERNRKRGNLFESIHVVESDFISHGHDELILMF